MKIYKVKVNGKTYQVELESIEENKSNIPTAATESKPAAAPASNGPGQDVLSPIQGTVINVKVKPGDKVKKGDLLLIVEAMKLENEINSPFDGEVGDILVSKGTAVAAKQPLLKIK